MKKIYIIVFVLFSLTGSAVAADGDLTVTGNATVDGNVGIGTTTPTQKLDVNGKVKGTGLCIGTNCTSTLHVSGGLYGGCKMGISDGNNLCSTAKSPASCQYGNCSCPTGYTLLPLSYEFSTCYKN